MKAIRIRVLVLAAALPLLFLHVHYQPGVVIHAGSTSVHAYLSDFAVLAVVVAALVSGAVEGWRPLRAGRPLWIAGFVFFAWVLAEIAWGRHVSSTGYAWHAHAVTGAKFFEYALLAPAVPLLLRDARDIAVAAWSLATWNGLAAVVGLAQFFGAAVFMADGRGGVRQASFIGSSDWAALAAATLLVGIVGIALPRLGVGRALILVATTGGVVGMIIAGALASVIGLATALVVLAVVLFARRELHPRRVAAVAATGLVVLAGTLAIRSSDLNAFRNFVDSAPASSQSSADRTPSYAHRTLLSWLGYEIWKDHPVLGVGWEGTTEPAVFDPYLPAAHRRFPNETPLAFPSANRRYGVQDAWIEAAADLGAVGLVFWAALFAAAAWLAAQVRRSATGLYALAGLGLLVWLWAAQGFYAGIPLDALTWLVFGVAVLRLESGGDAAEVEGRRLAG
ncbi:MAG TPA: O-antigen ligase family protein [Gaiellaceae bacterium]|nr:O-antigen ligase family protein [Gaiellaceae bacterium]